jgi:glucans biosynthesis protein C
MENKSNSRRFDLDWLRVLTILTVFLFHSLRFFVFEDWHIKNGEFSPVAEVVTGVINLWIMPMCFLVSGASVYYGFQKGKVGKFAKDKVLRLFVPLLVNMFSFSISQVYLDRRTHGLFSGSIIEFLPSYFHGIYGINGNFALVGMHLWYLAVLFLFSLLMQPVFVMFKTGRGERWLGKAGDFLGRPGLAYLLYIPIVLCQNLLSPDSILGFEGFNWNLGIYLWCFLAGYVAMNSQKLQRSILNLRWISIGIALAATVVAMVTDDVMEDMAMWFGVMAFFGFAMKHLNRSTPFLSYANQAVLPFYILHQTVLLGVGYFVMQWQAPILLKWAANTSISFAIIMVVYEVAVCRINLLRFLFGMKMTKKVTASAAVEEVNLLVQKY